MATQEHLHCERESCPLLAKKCSPHVFLIVLKFGACHECPPAGVNRDTLSEIVLIGEHKETEPQTTSKPLVPSGVGAYYRPPLSPARCMQIGNQRVAVPLLEIASTHQVRGFLSDAERWIGQSPIPVDPYVYPRCDRSGSAARSRFDSTPPPLPHLRRW
jgi:hypothetical protein